MRVRAITSMYYSKHQYEPGEEYTMDDREESEAKILHALGKIEILDLSKPKQAKPVPVQTKPPEYLTRTMEPAEPAAPMTTDNSPLVGPGPRYRRRDVRAQR